MINCLYSHAPLKVTKLFKALEINKRVKCTSLVYLYRAQSVSHEIVMILSHFFVIIYTIFIQTE